MNGNLMWCVITASLMALGPAHASTFSAPVDLSTLAMEAEGAYVATVTGLSSIPLDQARIESIVTLHIDQSLFGPGTQGEQITIVHAGGTFEDRVDHVSGAPRFHSGERVLLFVETREDGSLTVTQRALGKLEIIRDPYSGKDMVRATGSLAGIRPPPASGNAPPGVPGAVPLSEALKRVPVKRAP